MQNISHEIDFFNKLKNSLTNIDPVTFCQKYLTLDGKPFRLTDSGYRPFCDIYRYIGLKALEKDSKPLILLKGRQIGGTTMASALEMYFMGSGFFGNQGKPPIRIIHAFPQHDTAENYSKEKLNIMINSSLIEDLELAKRGMAKSYMQKLLDGTSESSNSLKFKQFVGGNFIRIDSTGLDGSRLRGGTADVIFYDEVQDIPGEAIGNTVEMLKQAKYGRLPGGVQVYFGTPKKKGSDFHKMWNMSSQQYYYLGCEKCNKHFPLFTPESDDWEKIWIREFIVKCTHCNHEQDKRKAAERGKWVSTSINEAEECRFIGFHINQLYMPHIKKEDIIAEKSGIHPTNTERKYRNEVLGEFYHGDTSPISLEEVIEKCGDRSRGLRAQIEPGDEQMVIMGIDYGMRSDMEQLAAPEKSNTKNQSYTTAVILSVKGPSLFSVDFALKFQRNDPESKKGIIDALMRKYSVNLTIGDIGFSNDFSNTLYTIYGDKYLVSRAQSKVNDKVKFRQDAYPKEIVFERDFYISELYELLKNGQIKFPLKDYDRIGWLINHCTSMELKPVLSKFGDPTIHYVKGSTPNDGMMALLNAYLAYKFLLTKGFISNNPFLQQKNIKDINKPLIALGYIKRNM